MFNFSELKRSLIVSLWFMFLTFPILVIRVNPIEKIVEWRWGNMLLVGTGSFLLSFIWRYFIKQREMGLQRVERGEIITPFLQQFNLKESGYFKSVFITLTCAAVIFPFIFSTYQSTIMTTVLMYVVLGLGLNIVVGLAGLLDLGYVAFYLVGAYSYALLNYHFGLGFWTVLPVGAIMGAFFGILLGFPVLRLRGDYLAIVTLGFGEIIRLIMENWNEFSFGPSGIANIPRPSFPGIQFSLQQAAVYQYFLAVGLTVFTIFVVNRLQDSRIGRAWIALREDEIACQAMGVDKVRTKLSAFALGATWAGMVGVMFAAKTTFINPASFTFHESALILSIVVLGGMGSVTGVIIGAFILILLPEYLRAFTEYRMLLFGAILVLMMVFRPQGIISNVRRTYELKQVQNNGIRN